MQLMTLFIRSVIERHATPRTLGDMDSIRIILWNLAIIGYYVESFSRMKLMNYLGYVQLENPNRSMKLLLTHRENH